MKLFELFNEWSTPTGEIQGKLLSGMMDSGEFSHVRWKRLEDGPSSFPGIKPTDTIVASSAWSAQDKIFGVIKFIQKNAHHKQPMQLSGRHKQIQKASVFHWEGIQFAVVRMRKAGETIYNIYAAPDNTPHQPKDEEIEEQNPKANAYALTGSGLGGDIRKPGKDTPYLKSVRTPKTTYSKTSKKQNWPATKHGAVDGFVG